MKYIEAVVHCTWGVFNLPNFLEEKFEEVYDDEVSVRTSPEVVEYFKKANLKGYQIVTFPTEATDTLLVDYDGCETLYYVLDGKIRVAKKREYNED